MIFFSPPLRKRVWKNVDFFSVMNFFFSSSSFVMFSIWIHQKVKDHKHNTRQKWMVYSLRYFIMFYYFLTMMDIDWCRVVCRYTYDLQNPFAFLLRFFFLHSTYILKLLYYVRWPVCAYIYFMEILFSLICTFRIFGYNNNLFLFCTSYTITTI